jgi:hypothetical protein
LSRTVVVRERVRVRAVVVEEAAVRAWTGVLRAASATRRQRAVCARASRRAAAGEARVPLARHARARHRASVPQLAARKARAATVARSDLHADVEAVDLVRESCEYCARRTERLEVEAKAYLRDVVPDLARVAPEVDLRARERRAAVPVRPAGSAGAGRVATRADVDGAVPVRRDTHGLSRAGSEVDVVLDVAVARLSVEEDAELALQSA